MEGVCIQDNKQCFHIWLDIFKVLIRKTWMFSAFVIRFLVLIFYSFIMLHIKDKHCILISPQPYGTTKGSFNCCCVQRPFWVWTGSFFTGQGVRLHSHQECYLHGMLQDWRNRVPRVQLHGPDSFCYSCQCFCFCFHFCKRHSARLLPSYPMISP